MKGRFPLRFNFYSNASMDLVLVELRALPFSLVSCLKVWNLFVDFALDQKPVFMLYFEM